MNYELKFTAESDDGDEISGSGKFKTQEDAEQWMDEMVTANPDLKHWESRITKLEDSAPGEPNRYEYVLTMSAATVSDFFEGDPEAQEALAGIDPKKLDDIVASYESAVYEKWAEVCGYIEQEAREAQNG
jgi:hypothetical protein